MPAYPAVGNDIDWIDISHWCNQDPVTLQWTLDPANTAADVAGFLNNDHRHYQEPTVSQIYDLVLDEFQMIFRNVGLEADPANDNLQYLGVFDQWHRNAAGGGTKQQLMRTGWNRILNKNQEAQGRVPCVPNYVPSSIQVDDNKQRGGLVLAEWDELTQDISDGTVVVPGYDWDPNNLTGYKNRADLVHNAWLAISGGRKFGACDAASVNQAIADQNLKEDRYLASLGTVDVAGKSTAAVNAANEEFNTNPAATRASVNAAGDAAYAAYVPTGQ